MFRRKIFLLPWTKSIAVQKATSGDPSITLRSLTEINYRGHGQLLWKMDYAREYLARFDDLELMLEQRLPYIGEPKCRLDVSAGKS